MTDAKGSDKARFSKIDADLTIIKWMLGVIIAGVAVLMAQAFVLLVATPETIGAIWR
jgi:hypothetical protein